MANEKNLKPFTSQQSREEAVKNGKKGGVRSGESRREKRLMRDSLYRVATSKEIDLDYIAEMERRGIPKSERILAESVSLALIKEAKEGNVSAYLAIRDTLGEKPTDKTENQNVNTFRIEFVDAGLDPIEEEET